MNSPEEFLKQLVKKDTMEQGSIVVCDESLKQQAMNMLPFRIDEVLQEHWKK
ncbi:unnamed protein product [Larinioides sclopetarius]|uniref:Uncharacterized protein n=1 Tax=Larinioides sclopetarius TaxID=280406 RepID=A0AAV1ZYS3_9ARAC